MWGDMDWHRFFIFYSVFFSSLFFGSALNIVSEHAELNLIRINSLENRKWAELSILFINFWYTKYLFQVYEYYLTYRQVHSDLPPELGVGHMAEIQACIQWSISHSCFVYTVSNHTFRFMHWQNDLLFHSVLKYQNCQKLHATKYLLHCKHFWLIKVNQSLSKVDQC